MEIFCKKQENKTVAISLNELKSKSIASYVVAIWRAWRPFSLTAAIIPTTLGSVIALRDGYFNLLTFILITIGGLLLQSGANLINDFFEFKSGILPEKNPQFKLTMKGRMLYEYLIFLAGIGCFALTVPIGLYLTYTSGIQLLIIGIIGFIGGYFYTGKPFSYKNKALGVVFVFFLMGVMMVYGSYYALSARFSIVALLASLPVSCLVSLLLISNEIRDIEIDKINGLSTLSVRIGYNRARILYLMVLSVTYVIVVLLSFLGILPILSLITLITIPYGLTIYKLTELELPKRRSIVPKTAMLHFIFGGLLIFSLIFDYYLNQ